MKSFFERYSYNSVQMLLNQVAISIFGFALAMTAVKAENDTLLVVTSVASVLFYLCLNYGTAWRVGSGDKVGVEYGKRPYRPLTGLWVSLLANSVNILLAVLIAIGSLADIPSMTSVCRFIALLAQGMYQGLLAVLTVDGVTINNLWWPYLVIVIPALLVSLVGYIAGVKDVHITNMGVPELPASDRPTRKEQKEMKAQKKQERK